MKKRIRFGGLVLASALALTLVAPIQYTNAEETAFTLSEFDLNMTAFIPEEALIPTSASVIELQIGNSSIYVDGTLEQLDENKALTPVIKDGYTFAPIQGIVEELGGIVYLDLEKSEIIVEYQEKTLLFQVGSKTITTHTDSDMTTEEMSVAPTIIDGQVMFPVSLLSQALDCEVYWVEEDRALVITQDYITKRLLVWMKDGVSFPDLGETDAEVFESGDGLYVIQCDSVSTTKNLFSFLETHSSVDLVTVDSTTALQMYIPNTSSFSRGQVIVPTMPQSPSSAVTQPSVPTVPTIPTVPNIPEQPNIPNQPKENIQLSEQDWGSSRTGLDDMNYYIGTNYPNSTLTVAVLDTGVEASHSLLTGRVLTGYNAINGGTNTNDTNGHGTMVSGIIASNTPDYVKIYPVRVMDNSGAGTELVVMNGMKMAMAQGVDVVNISFGSTSTMTSLEKLIELAVDSGITVVIAAGNESTNTIDCSPASLSSAIVVSSVDNSDQFSSFSNYGASVDLSAPGENVLTATIGNSYTYTSGTSFSAPYVAAASALVLVENPDFTPSQVELTLRNATDDRGSWGYDEFYGEGILNLVHYLNQ